MFAAPLLITRASVAPLYSSILIAVSPRSALCQEIAYFDPCTRLCPPLGAPRCRRWIAIGAAPRSIIG